MSSYLNIVAFLISTTIYYFALKPQITYADIQKGMDDKGKSPYMNYVQDTYVFTVIYFLLVTITQFMINVTVITGQCGGSVKENIGASAVYTFFPWIFIFGVMVVVLIINPGFKSVFSDIIGYYYVSYSANKIITTLLIDKDIQKELNNTKITYEEKDAIQNAADAIIKICGNSSILINQIVPSNFDQYMKELQPLIKDKYKHINNLGSDESMSLYEDLFNLVATRDNIGEAFWYMYVGILLIAIVNLQIVTRGCINNQSTMEQNYKTYLENEQKTKEREAAQKATYTVS